MTTNINFPVKDPDAVLDYKIDWAPATNGTSGGVSDWLNEGETITDYELSASPSGLTIANDALTDSDTSVTFWLSGGADGTKYSVTCHIVTNAGREDDRTIKIRVRER